MFHRENYILAFFCGTCSLTGVAMAEVIGPYGIIDAPTQAAVVSGGGGAFNWLNTVNAAVSIQEAFTGFSMIADGYGNAGAGTSILLTYTAGVIRNDSGPDLVLFDAGAGGGDQYLVSTNYDNFAHWNLVFPSIDTGEDRAYFYGGAGPTTVDVMAAEIELTQWGVPDGATVTQVRVFTEGPSCDLLGVGVLLSACPADINGDDNIGLSDSTILLAAWGSGPGQDDWNPRSDLSADGTVDLRDFAKLQIAFGNPCPP